MAQNDYEMHHVPEQHHVQQGTPKTLNGNSDPERPPLSLRSSITARDPVTIKLHSPKWPVVLWLLYAVLTLLPWVILCILRERPIRGTKGYFKGDMYAEDLEKILRANEHHIEAMEILRSIATLLTIPVTSAICSIACVAYMQSGSLRRNLTLRKSMALADYGWINPKVWVTLNAKSLPLYIAFGLTLLGVISQILQQAFMEKEDIRAHSMIYSSTYLRCRHPRLPTSRPVDAEPAPGSGFRRSDYVSKSEEHDSREFYSPVPEGISSGAWIDPMFAPRINSSMEYQNITADVFSNECRNETENGGFYATYYKTGRYDSYVSLTACMPADLRNTPWKATRDRQDITEVLYLNISNTVGTAITKGYYKATARTSLGYFELPSYKNGNKDGPLLDKDPLKELDSHEHYTQVEDRGWIMKRQENITDVGNRTLQDNLNKGPLTSLALALFGDGSFIETRLNRPSSYIFESPLDENGYSTAGPECVALQPLAFFFKFELSRCISEAMSQDEHDLNYQVASLLDVLAPVSYTDDAKEAMEAGLGLANKLWLTQNTRYYESLKIYSDVGIPTYKTKISTAGIIVGSVFLGIHLLGLLALVVYVVVMKPWVGHMGAEAMVRMGAAYADLLGAADGEKEWKATVEQLPGFIGDESPEETIGRMRLGAEAGLAKGGQVGRRRFEVLR